MVDGGNMGGVRMRGRAAEESLGRGNTKVHKENLGSDVYVFYLVLE